MIRNVILPSPVLPPQYAPAHNPNMCFSEMNALLTAIMLYDSPNVIEIGTHRGITANNIARLLSKVGGKLITVDVDGEPDTLPTAQRGEVLPQGERGIAIEDRHVKSGLVEQWVLRRNYIRTDLHDKLREWGKRRYVEKGFDVALLDGDHSLDGVAQDWALVSEFLSGGGTMLLHDVWWDVEPQPVVGPMSFLDGLGVGWGVINTTHLGSTLQMLERLQARYPWGRK
jgi:hypothetical protein